MIIYIQVTYIQVVLLLLTDLIIYYLSVADRLIFKKDNYVYCLILYLIQTHPPISVPCTLVA